MTDADTTTSAEHVPMPLHWLPLREPSPTALAAIAAFLPELEAPGATAGQWHGGVRQPNGVITFPCFVHSDLLRRFQQAAYDQGFVTSAFDWPEWSRTPAYKRLVQHPENIANCRPMTLAKLLTVIFRAERTCEGVVEGEFERGVFHAIARRAKLLAADI